MATEMGLVVAALVVVLVIVVLLKLLRGSSGDTVLLVGPCDAGKTTLFFQLRDGSAHLGTVASMQPNIDEFVLASDKPGARPVRVVDVPGHPRVRAQWEAHAPRAAGLVFVVDAVDFMPKKTDTAEQLYEILSHPAVLSRRLPVLLAANKADQGHKAHSLDFVRKRLEKEIDQIRGTRGTLADGTSARQVALGSPGEPFTFDSLAQHQGVRVAAASVSALDRGGSADVAAFIRRCVPA